MEKNKVSELRKALDELSYKVGLFLLNTHKACPELRAAYREAEEVLARYDEYGIAFKDEQRNGPDPDFLWGLLEVRHSHSGEDEH